MRDFGPAGERAGEEPKEFEMNRMTLIENAENRRYHRTKLVIFEKTPQEAHGDEDTVLQRRQRFTIEDLVRADCRNAWVIEEEVRDSELAIYFRDISRAKYRLDLGPGITKDPAPGVPGVRKSLVD